MPDFGALLHLLAAARSSTDDQHGASQITRRIEAKGKLIFFLDIIGPSHNLIACCLALLGRSLMTLVPPRAQPEQSISIPLTPRTA